MTTATGKSLPRVDGLEKVTGALRYAADVPIPDALWGRVLRSPLPYAKITAVDISAAASVPGVLAVITGADIKGTMSGRRIFDIPLLAHDVVRFIGDAVAAVAAVDKETADRAVELIKVDYEELTPNFDPLKAVEPGAVILHPDFNDYVGIQPQNTPSNVYAAPSWGVGDPDVGFAEADEIIEGSYTTALMHQAYMETHTCAVALTEDDRMDIWASNKAPHYVKAQVARTTGVEASNIHVHHVGIGGDFGGKGAQMNIPICYFLARKSGKPVRMVMDYAEEFSAANPRHPAIVNVKTGIKRDGTIVANEIVAYLDTGAYAGFVPLGFLPGPRHAAGPYKIPHSRVTAHHVYTNRVPAGHMRGPGEPQTIFAMESQIDVVAAKLGLDPAAVRLKNVIREGDINGLGEEYHELQGAGAIETALERSGYRDDKADTERVRHGRGVGIGERAPGGGETHAGVTIQTDGSVVIHTSIFEQGSGTYTILEQMVSDVLQIPTDRISVEVWDTEQTGFDSGAGASRNTRMASEASYQAAIEARAALFQLAATNLGWPDSGLEMTTDGLRNTSTGETTPLAAFLSQAGTSVNGTYDYKDNAHAHVTAFTVQVAEVAVDVETGEVKLTRLTSLHDAGRVLNPQGHTGQINGGAMQGVGYGLMEELPVDNGRVGALSFADYKIPTMADVPPMQAIALESEGGVGPFNIKGIGENPSSPMAPAIANAVADAVGVRITDLPITAEKVYRELRSR